MTIQINANLLIVVITILSVILLFVSTAFIILLQKMAGIKRQLDDTNRLLYFSMKDAQIARAHVSTCADEIVQIQQSVHTLSSGLQIKLQRDAEAARLKRFPKPDEAKQITATIKEQMAIQLVLRSQQSAPAGGSLEIITKNTLRTYPDISPDYLIEKCIAVVQDSINGRDQSE